MKTGFHILWLLILWLKFYMFFYVLLKTLLPNPLFKLTVLKMRHVVKEQTLYFVTKHTFLVPLNVTSLCFMLGLPW